MPCGSALPGSAGALDRRAAGHRIPDPWLAFLALRAAVRRVEAPLMVISGGVLDVVWVTILFANAFGGVRDIRFHEMYGTIVMDVFLDPCVICKQGEAIIGQRTSKHKLKTIFIFHAAL